MNALLGRKAISAGWKAKSPPPFRPTYELILNIVLPAHILDGFRIYCGAESLESWVATVQTRAEVHEVAKKIQIELCSPRRVSRLRRAPVAERDVPRENIMLFLYSALILREFKLAIRRGDVGRMITVFAHWMVIFRGTGKMPKYADTPFHIIVSLKKMNPIIR